MKSNELRVGNWVNNNEEDYQITSATIAQLERGDSTAQPIPLTDEWLLRIGFKKVGSEWRLHPSFEVQILVFNHEKYNGVMFYTRTIHSDYSPIYCTNHINYVHQLQNLYFALTGEELTLNHAI